MIYKPNNEQDSAKEIGTYGYAHWSEKHCDDNHTAYLVPQSMGDGWEAYCSCGHWRCFICFQISVTESMTREDMRDSLVEAHRLHVEKANSNQAKSEP